MEPYTKLAPKSESSGDSAKKLKADGPRGDASVASPFQDPEWKPEQSTNLYIMLIALVYMCS